MSSSTNILGGIALASCCCWTVAFVCCHLVRTGFNPIENAVSDYGSTKPSRPFALAQWWLDALTASLLVAALYPIFNPQFWNTFATSGTIALGVFAFARVGTSLFIAKVRRNPPPEQEFLRESPDGQVSSEEVKKKTEWLFISSILHVIFAIISFICLPIASVQLGKAFTQSEFDGTALGNNSGLLLGLGYAVLGGFLAMIATIWYRRITNESIFGIGERVLYITKAIWFFALAAVLTMW